MTIIAKIDDETVSADDFVKILRFNNTFDNLAEEVVVDKLTVHAAKKHGIAVTTDEVQEQVDLLRRINGLHRAKDTLEFIEGMGMDLDEFETYMTDSIYRSKMRAEVMTDGAVEAYFTLHSPKFESIEVSHMLLDSESKAREMVSLLEEDPDSFADLAREYSLDEETKEEGGRIGKVSRGAVDPEIEAKAFGAEEGDILGPFSSADGLFYEIYKVDAYHPATLDKETKKQVAKLVFDDWVAARIEEHTVEVL